MSNAVVTVERRWIYANGDVEALTGEDVTLTPTNWRASSDKPHHCGIAGPIPEQWVLPVLGKSVSVTGSHQGVGYMELAGYND